MLTQNRVQETPCPGCPRMCSDTRRAGEENVRRPNNPVLAVHLYSPDSSRDTLLYFELCDAARQGRFLRACLGSATCRIPGPPANMRFADLARSGQMVAAHNLSAGEVLAALRAQNVQVSAGVLNQPPVASREAPYQINVQTLGRLATPEQFAAIVLKSDALGACHALTARCRARRDWRIGLWVDRLHGSRTGHALANLRPAGGQIRLPVEHEVFVDHGNACKRVSARPQLQDHLRSDDICRQVGSTK